MKKITLKAGLTLLTLLLAISSVSAQEYIAVIQDPVVVLLNPTDGSIEDPAFIDLTPLDPSTPKALLQVGDEIWISDQLQDRIDRFDLDGNFTSTIDIGLDNIRGMELVDGEVWVTNAGTNNGAPGNAIIRYDFSGNELGFFPTTGSDSAFDIIDVGGGEVYISYISAESKIERRDYDGNVLGNVVGEGVVNFIQQMEVNIDNNSVYAAVFSVSGANSSGLYEFSIDDGSILNYYDEGNLRGVAQLENGNVLVSNAAGVRSLDPGTGISTPINGNSSQYFGRLSLEPCTPPATPIGDAEQSFPEGSTLADIVVTPSDVFWFATQADAEAFVNPLALSTVLEDGETYYAVAEEDGCFSDFLEVTVTLELDVNSFDATSLRLYPNPTAKNLTISHSNVIEDIQIHSILGQKVLEIQVNAQDAILDVSRLAEGIYTVTLEFGDRNQTVRFVKSK
ncbi:T9SS type A sorting domain-containing protein [Flavobacteriaceae bacterium TK19130]|nr:T9SS type A sorting domain-containing protein [Thermobacterium salinum]